MTGAEATAWYQRADVRTVRCAAVAARERAVPVEYEALARDLDQRYHHVPSDAVRAGRVGAGPVLRLLRSLVFRIHALGLRSILGGFDLSWGA